MFIKLHHNETYRGKEHEAGSVIEVGDDLGGRMILAGKATRASKPEDEITAESIEAMDFKDIKKHIADFGIKTADGKKETLIAALKAYYGVG